MLLILLVARPDVRARIATCCNQAEIDRNPQNKLICLLISEAQFQDLISEMLLSFNWPRFAESPAIV